jgi:hypothetical protein
MCRLHPLGCVTIGGRRKWLFRQPLCETNEAPYRTIEEWLRISRMGPFLAANARYFRWMRELLEDRENLSAITESQWETLGKILYDFDSIKPHTGKMNLNSIDEMFHTWLSGIQGRKKRGN